MEAVAVLCMETMKQNKNQKEWVFIIVFNSIVSNVLFNKNKCIVICVVI